ncbi:SpvB/TcaC N-terminal domain-containing protein [Bradyrhizobium sp. 144]|uniref:SpvB/TcaC N-terminal domain-containing protein n=1 Tax=Bradyrhizobium sp. 144 TaxID=2782620 RepID=UPI001FF73F37|nr:SpvB/TcaC N-terminal domain-containing protein [Bradyrhizobium sp. 144]MCK1698165.1 VCBS repeat-containing protein [Bradyrhizobium sp. 144]
MMQTSAPINDVRDGASSATRVGRSPAGGFAPSLNLPKGGGALRGIGEKFSFNAHTGTGSLSVPLPFLEARGGFGPNLQLTYDSGSGNGLFGAGWQLGVPTIGRKTDKGLPKYEDGDVFIYSGAEDLVPVAPTEVRGEYDLRRFRPRVEASFARIELWISRRNAADTHWRVISRDDVTHILGLTSEARIADPGDPTRVFQWLLQCSFDDKGNAVAYRYRPEDLVGVDALRLSEAHRVEGQARFAGSHIESVVYANREPFFAESGPNYWPAIGGLIESTASFVDNWQFRAFFDYTVRPADEPTLENGAWNLRADAFSSYRAGFEVRTARLCRRIVFESNLSVEIEGRETGYAGLTHALVFEYGSADPSATETAAIVESPILAKLRSLQQISLRRGNQATSYDHADWPPLEFDYSVAGAMQLRSIGHTDAPALATGVDGARNEWVDLDGEGIQGVLSRGDDAWRYAPNRWSPLADSGGLSPHEPLSAGAFRSPQPLSFQPSAAFSGATLVDLAGDGSLDVVAYSPQAALVYERNERGGWHAPRALPRRPAYALNDPNVRLVDLDGDGRAEIVVAEHDCFVWQEGLGEDGYGAVHRVSKLLDEKLGPVCVFSEVVQTIFLADMSGDGLTDIVRIRNGEVCYWPNLGYGRFGARIEMDNAPIFASPDQFDPARVRVLDVDGSGVADLVYLGRQGAAFWANHSGNGWSTRQPIPFRIAHNLAEVTSADFFGRGTGCLIWSSAASADAGSHFCVVDLTGGVKPHLLTRVRNNLGAETRLSYRSSTEFYLSDVAEGRPWITRLPFPVHVVQTVETEDAIARNLFVSRYAYHHGFFDGVEREFRGFGMVEQWDSEHVEAVSYAGSYDNWDSTSYVPPALTKTWFHHGAWYDDDSLVAAFKREYWDADSGAVDVADTVFPPELSPDEAREACRALRGRMLRQEVYALDAEANSTAEVKARAARPYQVIGQNFKIRMLQARGNNPHAVFFVHPRETVQAHYERTDPPDPRVSHALSLKVDDYGNVEQAVAIGYGRRQPEPEDPQTKPRQKLTPDEQATQRRSLLTLTVSTFTKAVDTLPDAWRTPLPAELRIYELGDSEWEKATALSFEALQEAAEHLADIPELAYGTALSYTRRERRLIEQARTHYRRNDLKGLLALGELESLALVGEELKLAITPGMADNFEGKVDATAMTTYLRDGAAGYSEPEGDGSFWISSGRTFFAPDANGTPQGAAAELAFARKRFFLPHRFVDAFGNATRVAYEDAILRIAEITDAADNSTRASYDYRVLQPKLISDANGNHIAAVFDLRGLVAATAVLGQAESIGEFGDTLEDVNRDPGDSEITAFFADPVGKASALLGTATCRYLYDVMRFRRSSLANQQPGSPVYAAALERRFHVKLPFADDDRATAWIGADLPAAEQIECRFNYSDGFGRAVQQKIRTAPQIKDTPGPAKPRRWLGSGWTIFNNKGHPVRQYEPFFVEEGGGAAPHEFEFRRDGVSPILFYDPLGRLAATLHPDHSWEKIVLDPWKQVTSDRNDTVLIDPLNDPDVAAFFRRLPSDEWKLIEGASPTWYRCRTTTSGLNDLFPGNSEAINWRRQHEHDAALKTASTPDDPGHAGTPTRTHFDALGRAFLVVTHNRYVDPRSQAKKEEFAHTRTLLDIEGNRRAVFDALERAVTTWDYDLLGRPLREAGMDAGRRWTLPDAASQPLRRWDDRDHAFRHRYDALRRPLENWLAKASDAAQTQGVCYERFTYGEHEGAPADRNLRGRLWKHEDTAGLVTVGGYDAKGNLASWTRRFCRDYKTTPDWSTGPALEEETAGWRTDYDALNRPIRLITPYARKNAGDCQTFARYNLAGQLFATTVRTPAEPFLVVRGIDYNARGQRRVIQYGNNKGGHGLRTTLSYDDKTFRLLSLVTANTDPDARTDKYQALDYVYDPVGNVIAVRDTAQPTFYFKQKVAAPDADYEYDALYRLTSASGREHEGQNRPPNAWDVQRAGTFDGGCGFTFFPNPNDTKAMRPYTQRYAYDMVGNIEEMLHQAGGQGSWRRVYGYELVAGSRDKGSNRLVSTVIGGVTERYNYDAHGSMVAMPHLAAMETDFRDQLSVTARQSVRCEPDRPYARGDVTYYVYDAAGERARKVTEREGRRVSERRYLGAAEDYRSYAANGKDLDVERMSLHVSDGERRFALFETVTNGGDDAAKHLIRSQFPNHLGSASLEVQFDKKAPVISYEEFYPFGTTAYLSVNASIKAASKRYRYTGKERDEESGLNYHGARYLAVWLGRWVSADPSGLADGPNVYWYSRCNPLMRKDDKGTRSAEVAEERQLQPQSQSRTDAPGWLVPGSTSLLSTVDAFKRLDYAAEISTNRDLLLKVFDKAESLDHEFIARSAFDLREETRGVFQEKLSQAGKAFSEAVEKEKTFEQLLENKSFRQIVDSSGKTTKLTKSISLTTVAKGFAVVGTISLAFDAKNRVERVVAERPQDRTRRAAYEAYDFAGSALAASAGAAAAVGFASGVAAGLAGAAVGTVALPVVAALLIGGLGAYAVSQLFEHTKPTFEQFKAALP